MNFRTAWKIMKSKISVTELTDDWEISLNYKNVNIFSKKLNFKFTVSHYLFIKNYNNLIKENKIEGLFRFSSIGLISENDYYLAKQFFEEEKLKKYELKKDSIYVGRNGKLYVYIDNKPLYTYVLEDKELKLIRVLDNKYLYDIEKDKFINYNSVSLIKEIEEDIFSDIYLERRLFNEYFNRYIFQYKREKKRKIYIMNNNIELKIFLNSFEENNIFIQEKEIYNKTKCIKKEYHYYNSNFGNKIIEFYKKINITKLKELLRKNQGQKNINVLESFDKEVYFIEYDEVPF